jgi:hypothetical protein
MDNNTDSEKATQMTVSDLGRLEKKIDEVAESIKSLVLIEERQVNQRAELEAMKTRVEGMGAEQGKINRRIDRLVNLVLGGWAVLVVLFEVYRAIEGM